MFIAAPILIYLGVGTGRMEQAAAAQDEQDEKVTAEP